MSAVVSRVLGKECTETCSSRTVDTFMSCPLWRAVKGKCSASAPSFRIPLGTSDSSKQTHSVQYLARACFLGHASGKHQHCHNLDGLGCMLLRRDMWCEQIGKQPRIMYFPGNFSPGNVSCSRTAHPGNNYLPRSSPLPFGNAPGNSHTHTVSLSPPGVLRGLRYLVQLTK